MTRSSTLESVADELKRSLAGEPRDREDALERLSNLKGDNVALIASGLDDREPAVRTSAAVGLGAVRREAAVPNLLNAAVTETDEDVLRYVCMGLRYYTSSAIEDALFHLLERHDADGMRREIVAQLWKYQPFRVAPVLGEIALCDDNDSVRLHAADSLEILSRIAPASLMFPRYWAQLAVDPLAGVARIASNALEASRGGTPDLLELLQARIAFGDTAERAHAIYRTTLLWPTAPHLVVTMLDDAIQDVRCQSYLALGAMRHEPVVHVLLDRLDAADTRELTALLLALEEFHDDAIGSKLLSVAKSHMLVGDAASILYRQLWKYPSVEAIDLLEAALGSPTKVTQRSAVQSTLEFMKRVMLR